MSIIFGSSLMRLSKNTLTFSQALMYGALKTLFKMFKDNLSEAEAQGIISPHSWGTATKCIKPLGIIYTKKAVAIVGVLMPTLIYFPVEQSQDLQ